MDLCIKLIEVEGQYKALVMDMAKKTDRLLFIATNINKDLAWDEAESYIKSIESKDAVCH